MAKFRIFWLDDTQSDMDGDTISDAFRKAGYGGGAINAVDYYIEADEKPIHVNGMSLGMVFGPTAMAQLDADEVGYNGRIVTWVSRIIVPEKYRGLGFGTQLLKRFTDLCDIHGRTACLCINAYGGDNGPTHDDLSRWYIANGFSKLDDGSFIREPQHTSKRLCNSCGEVFAPVQDAQCCDRCNREIV